MKVRLAGTAFEITPMSEERQLITREGHRTWLWDVVPLESGTKELTLSADAEVVLPGQDPMPVDTRVFTSQITVTARKVPLTEKTKNFLVENWEFFVGTIILGTGISKWVYDRIRRRFRREEDGLTEGEEVGKAAGAEVEEIDFAALEASVIGRRDYEVAEAGRPEAGPDDAIDFAALEEAVIGRRDHEVAEAGWPEEGLDEVIDFAALEEAVIGRRDHEEGVAGRPEAGLDDVIDFAALEEAAIGRRDHEEAEAGWPEEGLDDAIDFAALEEAVTGRRDQMGLEEDRTDAGKEDEGGADREGVKRAEEDSAGAEGKVIGEIGAKDGRNVHPEDETTAETVSEQMRGEKNLLAEGRPSRGRKIAYKVIRGGQPENKAAEKKPGGGSRAKTEELTEIPGKTGRPGDKASLKRRKDEEEKERGSRDRKIGLDQSEEMTSEGGREEPKEMKEAVGKAERGKANNRRGGRYRKKAENGSILERKYRKRPDKKDWT